MEPRTPETRPGPSRGPGFPGGLRSVVIGLLGVLPLATGCDLGTGPNNEPDVPDVIGGLRIDLVAEGLQPLTGGTSPDGDPRLFVMEKSGAIRILVNGGVLGTPFLDLASRVRDSGAEQGLLGLAFHPSFVANGRFFVSYTTPTGDSRIEEYHANPASEVADPDPVRVVLEVPQPFENHNGGHIAFGPDGMLYIGLGDGGGSYDPDENAQDLSSLLGKILRIDVDGEPPYEIPPDNPYAGNEAFRPEIWAWGLRNPWRFTWDPQQTLFYVADVGQSSSEEVNFLGSTMAGVNYGWPVAEGSVCLGDPAFCEQETHLPQLVYDHTVGCAVIGGPVYTGSAIPSLQGHYLFGDQCAGWVRTAEVDAPVLIGVFLLDLPSINQLNSFAQDGLGEVYVLTGLGRVGKLVRDGT